MATYYVSPTGNDGNSGTSPSTPWRSLNKGMSVLKAGDTLLMRGGVYYESRSVTLGGVGASSQPITVAAYGNEVPIIDGSGSNLGNWSGLFDITGSNIIVDGLTVRNTFHPGPNRVRGFRIFKGGDVTLRHCTAYNTSGAPFLMQDMSGGFIENCTAYDGAMVHSLENRPNKPPGDWNWPGAGFTISRARNVVVRKCLGYGGWGEIAIADKGAVGVTFEDNIFHTTWAPTYVNRSQDIIWRRNFVYTTRREDGVLCRGIFLANETNTSTLPPLNNILVENNIIVGALIGVGADTYGFGGMTNVTIRHNTIVNSFKHAVRIQRSEAIHKNFIVENNVFFGSGEAIAHVLGSGVTWRNNCWGVAPPPAARGAGDIVGDPKLVNPNASIRPGAGDPNNYKLTANSPCIDMARPSSVSTDYFGGKRD